MIFYFLVGSGFLKHILVNKCYSITEIKSLPLKCNQICYPALILSRGNPSIVNTGRSKIQPSFIPVFDGIYRKLLSKDMIHFVWHCGQSHLLLHMYRVELEFNISILNKVPDSSFNSI